MKLKRKLAALAAAVMMTTSALSMSTSAYTYYDDWGPRYFTPQHGEFYAFDTGVVVRNMYWSEASIRTIQQEQMANDYKGGYYASEFEFRPQGYRPYQIWSAYVGIQCNMPDYYPETELGVLGDDVTVGCGRTAACVAGQSYYGYLDLKRSAAPPAYPLYTFSSEYGFRPKDQKDPVPQCH